MNDVAHEDEGAGRVAEIEALGRRAVFVPADVSGRRPARGWWPRPVRRLGRLDVFCANAGVARWQTLADVTPEAFAAVVGVNLHGCFFGCQAAAARCAGKALAGGSCVTSSV